jgi:hypothetical protein
MKSRVSSNPWRADANSGSGVKHATSLILSGNSARTGRAARLGLLLQLSLAPRVAARALSGDSARPGRTTEPGVVAVIAGAAGRAARALKSAPEAAAPFWVTAAAATAVLKFQTMQLASTCPMGIKR